MGQWLPAQRDDQWLWKGDQWLPRSTTHDVGLTFGVESQVVGAAQVTASGGIAMQSDLGVDGGTASNAAGSLVLDFSSNMVASAGIVTGVSVKMSLDMLTGLAASGDVVSGAEAIIETIAGVITSGEGEVDETVAISVASDIETSASQFESADLTMNTSYELTSSGEGTAEGALGFDLETAITTILAATAEADVSIESLNLQIDADVFVAQVGMPGGRTLIVKFRNRTLEA